MGVAKVVEVQDSRCELVQRIEVLAQCAHLGLAAVTPRASDGGRLVFPAYTIPALLQERVVVDVDRERGLAAGTRHPSAVNGPEPYEETEFRRRQQ